MTAGLQTFRPDGSVLCDITSRIGKVLGLASVGNSTTGASMTGTITDSRFTAYAGTTPWWGIISSTFFRNDQHPDVSIAGNVLTWTFPTGSARPDVTIIYGLF